MSLIIPEIIVQRVIDNLIAYVQEDWNTLTDKTKTVLYKLWNGVSNGGYDYYEQSQAVFLKTSANTRKIKILPSFPTDKSKFPCVVINTPSQQSDGVKSIGYDENVGDVNFNDDDLEFTSNFSRSFAGNYAISIYSDNREEVQLIYYTLQSLLMASFDHLSHCGFQNLRISGRELQMLPQEKIGLAYIRAIMIDGFITQTVDSLFNNSMVQGFNFTGTPIDSSFEI